MNYDDKTAFLKKYLCYARKAQEIEEEIEEWNAYAEKITASYSFAPSKGGDTGNKIEIAIEKIESLTRELTPELLATVVLRKYIRDSIEMVYPEHLQDVLKYIYIKGMKREAVSLKLAKDRTTIWRWHNQAIEEINLNMDEYKKRLQNDLETLAVRKNDGICQTYSYCEFCSSPTDIFKRSDTPCADAYLKKKEKRKLFKKSKMQQNATHHL